MLIAKMYQRKMLRNAGIGNVPLRKRNQAQSKQNCLEWVEPNFTLVTVIRIKREWSKFSWIIKKLQAQKD